GAVGVWVEEGLAGVVLEAGRLRSAAAAHRKIADGSRRPRRGADGRWQLLAPPGIMRDAVWRVGPTATKLARRCSRAMTPSGVQVSVIVRKGNEDPSASLEDCFGRASTGDCPRRQPTPSCVHQRHIGPPRPSTPTGAALRYQTEIPLRSTIRDDQPKMRMRPTGARGEQTWR